MKISLDKKKLQNSLEQLRKIAKVRRGSKTAGVSIRLDGTRAFLCLGGIEQNMALLECEGRGSVFFDFAFFEKLIYTLKPEPLTIACNGKDAQILQGKAIITLPAGVFKIEYEKAVKEAVVRQEKSFAKANRDLFDGLGGAEIVVYLDAENQTKYGTFIKNFKINGIHKVLVADENRNVVELLPEQIVSNKTPERPKNDLWKSSIGLPLKFNK